MALGEIERKTRDVPPRVPGTRFAMKIGLRPFSLERVNLLAGDVLCTAADSVCSRNRRRRNLDRWLAAPTLRVASMTRSALGSSLLLVVSYFWKPAPRRSFYRDRVGRS